MAQMGRPRIEIDWEEFDKLCYIQATLVEIADWFECCEDTIQNRVNEEKGMTFSAYYKKKSAGGKMSLRRKQVEIAQKGNVTMLIWLGKQYLDQSDKNQTMLANSKDKENEIEPFQLIIHPPIKNGQN